MIFNSPIYLLLLFITYILLNLNIRKSTVLIISSITFLSFFGIRDFSIFLIAFFFNWILQNLKIRGNYKLYLSFLLNLGLIFLFKYYYFFLNVLGFNFNNNLILPIGISFYSFQLLSYHIDSIKKKKYFTKSFKTFFIYVGFFPQLIAGPIMRASKLIPQIENIILKNKIKNRIILYGLFFIFLGLLKKVIFADSISLIVDDIFLSIPANSIIAWAGAFLFSFQIYLDFSGYSDIAIGSAYLLGLSLVQNFRTPYFANNPSDFWKRWHISLSSWIRDYIYIPLGGSKEGLLFSFIILVFSMTLAGIWHGANFTFILWGFLWGLYIFVYRVLLSKFIKSNILMWLVNFLVLVVLWVIFRSENISYAIEYLILMFDIFNSNNFVYLQNLSFQNLLLFTTIPIILFIFHYFELVVDNKKTLYLIKKNNNLVVNLFLIILILFLVFLPNENENPFIYFRF